MDRAWLAWLLLLVPLGPAEVTTRKLVFASGSVAAVGGLVTAAAGGSLALQVAVFAVIATACLAVRRRFLPGYLRAVERYALYRGTADFSGAVRRVRNGDPNDLPVTRVSWREAEAARAKLTGGYVLTSDERRRLEDISFSRRRYTGRLFNRIILGLVAAFCCAMIAVTALGAGPAPRAAQGHGIRGVFTAKTQSCGLTCSWTGTFTGAGTVLPDVEYDDKLPASTRVGSTFPALYPGGSNEVFAAHGSTAWLIYLWLGPLCVVGLGIPLWLGPVRWYLRRRKRSGVLPLSGPA